MNRCTQLDETLDEHVPWQPLEAYWISRSKVKLCETHSIDNLESRLDVIVSSAPIDMLPASQILQVFCSKQPLFHNYHTLFHPEFGDVTIGIALLFLALLCG